MGFIFNSLGAGEILVVLVAGLLLFGAEKLPSLARALGRSLNEMRTAANDLSGAVFDNESPARPGDAVPGQSSRESQGEDRREG